MYHPHSLGKFAEEAACTYLQKQGLQLITRNYRSRVGEIDLIMRDKQALVFVEVKIRSNQNIQDMLESVTKNKQIKIAKTAMLYLQKNHLLNKTLCRFDVIAVIQHENNTKFKWIKQAFSIK